jgi:guanylate kinase
VSVTTRPRRAGEIDGDHYHFISASQFDQLGACDGLLEWATFAGNRYGTPSEPVRAQVAAGNAVLLEIELEGARQVRSRVPDALMVFLAPPSFADLEERLRGRGTEDEAAIGQRLARARAEMAAASEFDAVIVNDDVGRAAHALLSLLAPTAQ